MTTFPEPLQIVSKWCYSLAAEMDAMLPEGAEKTAGLRKLLEAKDCFVRAELEATIWMIADKRAMKAHNPHWRISHHWTLNEVDEQYELPSDRLYGSW